MLQSDLHFTRHKPSLVINLHVALRGWEKKKNMKRNKTLNHESAFGTNCTHSDAENLEKKKKEAHALVAGGPVLYLWVLHRAFGL